MAGSMFNAKFIPLEKDRSRTIQPMAGSILNAKFIPLERQ